MVPHSTAGPGLAEGLNLTEHPDASTRPPHWLNISNSQTDRNMSSVAIAFALDVRICISHRSVWVDRLNAPLTLATITMLPITTGVDRLGVPASSVRGKDSSLVCVRL